MSAEHASLAAFSQAWRVERLQAGKLQELPYRDKTWITAIYKEPLESPVAVDFDGIVGDQNTGVPRDRDRAICCHSIDHYAFWRAYFRRDIPIGFFGENLTISGVLDEDLCVGDLIRCGTTILQVTQPRTPCFKQARKLEEPAFVKLLLQTGKIGFLVRVIQPGELALGDRFELIERPHPEANLVFVNRKLYEDDDREAAIELAQLEPLAHDWKAQFAKRASAG